MDSLFNNLCQGTTMPSIEIIIPGIPAPQGSKRHIGRGILVESSQRLKPWRADAIAAIQTAARDRKFNQITTAATLHARFYFPFLKSHYTSKGILKCKAWSTPKTSAPDLDKLMRALCDALTQSGLIRDDSIIVSIRCSKAYSDRPETYLRLEALS